MPPPPLMEDLVEEILLRLPPDDPASLARAALVSNPAFRRRFGEVHRTAPMLGFIHSVGCASRFVPDSSFRPRCADRARLRAIDSRHGRVLLRTVPWDAVCPENALVVWDPVTDEGRVVPPPPWPPFPNSLNWNAAVLCAAVAEGGRGGCSHLDCHRDPFLVVFVGSGYKGMFACVYSSRAGDWSKPTYAGQIHGQFELVPSALVGNAVYFMFQKLLKYDLAKQAMSVIDLPPTFYRKRSVFTTTEDGGLGLASLQDYKLYVWSWEAGPEEDVGWELRRVIKLKTLRAGVALLNSPDVVGFVDGVGVIFVGRNDVLLSVDLTSGWVTKVGERIGFHKVVPYVSFCLPALGSASAGEGPRAVAGARFSRSRRKFLLPSSSVCFVKGIFNSLFNTL